MNNTFNKHFVFHNLSMISKKIQNQEVNEDTLSPLLSTLNRVRFSNLDSDDAKRLLDSIDFKSGNIELSNNHFEKVAANIIRENPAFMDDLLNENKKRNKSDSFANVWTQHLNHNVENSILMSETADINLPAEHTVKRRSSLSMH